jgi:hypothetical protein
MTNPDGSAERVETYVDEDTGTGRLVIQVPTEGSGTAHFPGEVGQADMRAVGNWYDDEPPVVTVTVGVGGAEVKVQLEPEDARRFGADLRTAATNALQGDADLGERTESGE